MICHWIWRIVFVLGILWFGFRSGVDLDDEQVCDEEDQEVTGLYSEDEVDQEILKLEDIKKDQEGVYSGDDDTHKVKKMEDMKRQEMSLGCFERKEVPDRF